MSIGSLGAVGSMATAPAAQRGSDIDKTQAATAEQTRTEAAAEYAEKAAGIGETHEESGASERDADGRRLWEVTERTKENEAAVTDAAAVAKDPNGEAGGQLDLLG